MSRTLDAVTQEGEYDIFSVLPEESFAATLDYVTAEKQRNSGVLEDLNNPEFIGDEDNLREALQGFYDSLQYLNDMDVRLFDVPDLDLFLDDGAIKVEVLESFIQQFVEGLDELKQGLEQRLVDPYAVRSGEEAAAGPGGYGVVEMSPEEREKKLSEERSKQAAEAQAVLIAEKRHLVFDAAQSEELAGVRSKLVEVSRRFNSAAVAVEDDKSPLQDLEEYRKKLLSEPFGTKDKAVKNSELVEVARKARDLVLVLKKERSERLEKIAGAYERLAAGAELRNVKAITEELNANLQYLREMPSIALLEGNLTKMGKLMDDAAKLSSSKVYDDCYGSILAIAEKSVAPFVEFSVRHEGLVAPEYLTDEDIKARDEDVHDDVEQMVLGVADTIYKKNLKDEITKLGGKNADVDVESKLAAALLELDGKVERLLEAEKVLVDGKVANAAAIKFVSEKISSLRSEKFESLERALDGFSQDIVKKKTDVRTLVSQQEVNNGEIEKREASSGVSLARELQIATSETASLETGLKFREEIGKSFFKRIFYKFPARGLREKEMAEIRSKIPTLKTQIEETQSLINARASLKNSISEVQAEVTILKDVEKNLKDSIKEVAKLQEIQRVKNELVPEKFPSKALRASYQQSADEQALGAVMGAAVAYNEDLLARQDVSKVIERMENIGAKQESFSDILTAVLVSAFERSGQVVRGEIDLEKSTTRKFVGLGVAVARTIGGPAEPAIKVAGLVLDKILGTWDSTANQKVYNTLAMLGEENTAILVSEISKRVAELYANDGSADAAFNRFNKEATLYGLAANVAISVIDALGAGDVSLNGKIPNEKDVVVGEDGTKEFAKSSAISQYVDEIISETLGRSKYSELFKPAQKLIGNRSTTEDSSRGNITAMGAKQGVGIELTDEEGKVVRLVPKGRQDAKYGFRKATKREEALYRQNKKSLVEGKLLLDGYEAYDPLDRRYGVEMAKLLDIVKAKIVAPAIVDDGELANKLSKIMIFYADQKQFNPSSKDSVVSLKTFAATQGLAIGDDEVRSIGALADIYNEATGIRTKKGLALGGVKIDLMSGAALAVQTALGNEQVMARIGNVDPFTGQPFLLNENVGEVTISDVFRVEMLEPQRNVLGQLKVFLEKQLGNPDFDFLVKTSGKTALNILEDIATIMQINAAAIVKNTNVLDEKLRDIGLFNLGSPINNAKFNVLKELALSLAKIEVKFQENHNEDMAQLYYRYNSAERQYDERLGGLSKLLFGVDLAALDEGKKADLTKVVAFYAGVLADTAKAHGTSELKASLDRELKVIHDKYLETRVGDVAAIAIAVKRAADALNLSQAKVVDRGSSKVIGAVTAIKKVGAIKDRAEVRRGFVRGARKFVNMFKDKDVDQLAAELAPTSLDKNVLMGNFQEFLRKQISTGDRVNSLIAAGQIHHGSVEERVADFSSKIVGILQGYAEFLVRNSQGRIGIPKDVQKLLVEGVSSESLLKYLKGVPEFQSMIDLNKSSGIHNKQREEFLGLVGDLVKLNVKEINREVARAEVAAPQVRLSFERAIEGFAAKLNIVNPQDKVKLRGYIADYVEAVAKDTDDRRYRKYGNMLALNLKSLGAVNVDRYVADINETGFGAGEISSAINAYNLDKAAGKIVPPTLDELKEKVAGAISLRLNFNRTFLDSVSHSMMFADGAEIIAQANLEAREALLKLATSAEFARKDMAGKKKEVEKYFNKGSNETSLMGRTSGWSEERLRFDALVNAVVNLSVEHQRQRETEVAPLRARAIPGALPSLDGDVISVVSDVSSVAIDEEDIGQSTPVAVDLPKLLVHGAGDVKVTSVAEGVEQVSRNKLATLVKGVDLKEGVGKDTFEKKIAEVVTAIAGSIKVANSVGRDMSQSEVTVARKAAKEVLKECMNIGSAGLFAAGGRDDNRQRFDAIFKAVRDVAQAQVNKERAVGVVNPHTDVIDPRATNFDTGRAVPKAARGGELWEGRVGGVVVGGSASR